MKKLCLAAFIIFLGYSSAFSCVCAPGHAEPFLKATASSDLIIRGKVVRYNTKGRKYHRAMDVQVVEYLKGKTDKKQIRIWGDDGHLCRPYVDFFPIDSEWVFAVTYVEKPPGKGDFELSNCGEYWLEVINHKAVGRISNEHDPEAKEEISLEDLKKKLKQ